MPVYIADSVLQEVVNAVAEIGSQAGAARKLGIPAETLKSRLHIAKRRGIEPTSQQFESLHGVNPDAGLTHGVPSPFVVRGYSNYYNKDGELAGQWIKTKLDDLKLQQAICAAIDALSKNIARVNPTPPPNLTSTLLCNQYTYTDAHVGMYAWAAETGEDWDLSIAEQMLTRSFDYLVDASPPAHTAIVSELGDFLHFDSLAAITPTHGHLLDADSRFSKVVKVAISILRHIVNRALEKHNIVIVIIKEGNHDMASAVWMRHLFSLLYENEPRVQVVQNESPYYALQHGEVMLGYHHGHLKKNEALPLLFAAQYPNIWGATTKRYVHTGHLHHHRENEHSGVTVIQHPTIAARDAHAARGGWIANRKIKAVTYHSKYGEVATTTVTPEMLE